MHAHTFIFLVSLEFFLLSKINGLKNTRMSLAFVCFFYRGEKVQPDKKMTFISNCQQKLTTYLGQDGQIGRSIFLI